MTDLEQTIMREIAALPKAHHADVLAFVRYLKQFTPSDKDLENRFGKVFMSIRAMVTKLSISQESESGD